MFHKCYKITSELINHPICIFFSRPVDPEIDNAPDYLNIIQKPIDLRTILKNLQNEKYKTISEWKSDIELIWKNAEKYNGQYHIITQLAKSIPKILKKLCIKYGIYSLLEWNDTIFHFFQRINNLTKNAPSIVLNHIKIKETFNDMTNDEINIIIEALSQLKSKNDILQILQLLHSFGYSLNTSQEEIIFDINQLSNYELQILFSFLKDKFKEYNFKFPSK